MEGRFSTASSYEDALKSLIKYRRHLRGLADSKIKTLFEIMEDKMVPLDEFKDLDMEIKAIDYGFTKDFKAYLTNRYASKNTPAIYLRSLQAIMNDARKTYEDLKDHTPLSGIKKKSHANAPRQIKALLEAEYPLRFASSQRPSS